MAERGREMNTLFFLTCFSASLGCTYVCELHWVDCVLQVRSSEVNLDEFACQENVSVSFAVATLLNVSGFSPPTNLTVTNDNGESSFTGGGACRNEDGGGGGGGEVK